jgi:hypothetical protein
MLFDDITPAEETTVDGVVAVHIPTPLPPGPDQPIDTDGKPFVRSETRPINCTTYFTSQGDDIAGGHIGGGKELRWDFSGNDDIITAPAVATTPIPTGFKRKRIEFSFIDPVYLKSGILRVKDTMEGGYFDFYVVCSAGGYLPVGPNGSLVQMPQDVPVAHFVNHFVFLGDANIVSTNVDPQTISQQIPTFFKFWIEVTTPDTDTASKGGVTAVFYRERTVA